MMLLAPLCGKYRRHVRVCCKGNLPCRHKIEAKVRSLEYLNGSAFGGRAPDFDTRIELENSVSQGFVVAAIV